MTQQNPGDQQGGQGSQGGQQGGQGGQQNPNQQPGQQTPKPGQGGQQGGQVVAARVARKPSSFVGWDISFDSAPLRRGFFCDESAPRAYDPGEVCEVLM